MLNVVAVDVAGVRTAGELTVLVPGHEGAAKGGR
jgi:hypothetical protein